MAKMAELGASEILGRTKDVRIKKVIVSEFVTLDGGMEDLSWTF
jgi:hypothetical protein